MLLSSRTQGHKDLWKSFKHCHVGIHWIALLEYSQMSTHIPGFQSFACSGAPFCFGQISHQQHKGWEMKNFAGRYLNKTKKWRIYVAGFWIKLVAYNLLHPFALGMYKFSDTYGNILITKQYFGKYLTEFFFHLAYALFRYLFQKYLSKNYFLILQICVQIRMQIGTPKKHPLIIPFHYFLPISLFLDKRPDYFW